jgi:hypothetical protein
MWILRRMGEPETLYLMKSGTRQYLDKVNLDSTSVADLRWLSQVLGKWFERQNAPQSLVSYDPALEEDPEPADSSPEPPGKTPGTGEPAEKPLVIRKPTPNQSSRNGVGIKRIVLHYTTTRSDQSTISWFANPAARVSAHYLVSRDGTIYQFVSDGNKAWHAAGQNSDTIGIENSAAPGDTLTPAQEAALVKLCRFLMAEYRIPPAAVTAHRFLGQSTSCPGDLWKSEAELKHWVNNNLKRT